MINSLTSPKNIKLFGLVVLFFGFCLTLWAIYLSFIIPTTPPPLSPPVNYDPEEHSNFTSPSFLTQQTSPTSTSSNNPPPPHKTSDVVPRIDYEKPKSGDVRLWSGSWFHPETSEKWRRCVKEQFTDFPSVSSYTERPVIIYTWNTLSNFLYIHPPSVETCPVPCLFASNFEFGQSCLEEVDGFVFHPPTMNKQKVPKKKLPYQQWTLFCTESEHNYPILDSQEFRSQFDINMTYHIADQVPFTYFIAMDYYLEYYPFLYPKPEKAPVMMMISNCKAKNRRGEYLQQLMKYIQIDSYGGCLKNKEIPPEMKGWPWYEVKWNLTSRYKFVISFENSIGEDYVSEKLFHSFIAGSVPIYWGAPNIEDFLPSEKSIIKMTDFRTPRDLASYLLYLDKNETAFFEYLDWKVKGEISKEFYRLENTSPRTGPCRLCLEVARRQRKLFISQKDSSNLFPKTSYENDQKPPEIRSTTGPILSP